jgi:hypothetical protein
MRTDSFAVSGIDPVDHSDSLQYAGRTSTNNQYDNISTAHHNMSQSDAVSIDTTSKSQSNYNQQTSSQREGPPDNSHT